MAKIIRLLISITLLSLITSSVTTMGIAYAAACPTTDGGYGSVSGTVDIPQADTYRIWSRLKSNTAGTQNNDSYWLIIDGTTCFEVGDNHASIPDNQWTWIDWQDGNTASKVNQTFSTTGTHTIKLLGREANVQVDRVLFTTDTTSTDCNPPTGTGDVCAVNNPVVTVVPTAVPTASATGLTATAVSSTQINLSWVASATANVTYDVYRAVSGGSASKVATVTSTSFGDTGLTASTAYSYYIITRDSLGGTSTPSATVSATTQAPPPVPTVVPGVLTGTVKDNSGSVPRRSKVSIVVNGTTKSYTPTSTGSYTITNLPPNTYTVTYSASKYINQSYAIAIPSGGAITKNVILVKR